MLFIYLLCTPILFLSSFVLALGWENDVPFWLKFLTFMLLTPAIGWVVVLLIDMHIQRKKNRLRADFRNKIFEPEEGNATPMREVHAKVTETRP